MIAPWMFGAMVFSMLCGIAAVAAERGLRILGRPSRAPWAIAVCVAAGWPLIAPFLLSAPPAAAGALGTVGAEGIARVSIAVATSLKFMALVMSFWSGRFDAVLLSLWALASFALIVQTLMAILQLRRIRRHGRAIQLDGEPVLVDDTIGPAVIGVLSPVIVVPSWLTELDSALRDMVLRHEREHCRARDGGLVWLSVIATTAMPWNAALWWLTRRLRTAMEIDCDARTIGDATDRSQYAKLLLLIAQHHSSARFAPALSPSASSLHRRLRAMKTLRVRFPMIQASVAGSIALAAMAVACSPRVASNLTSPLPANRAVAESSNGAAIAPVTADTPPYFDFQVTSPAAMAAGSVAPPYPAELRAAGTTGSVLAQYVVNTDGTIDVSTFKNLRSNDDRFVASVRAALPAMRYTPALLKGKAVRQLVQQPFAFQLSEAPESATRPSVKAADQNSTETLKTGGSIAPMVTTDTMGLRPAVLRTGSVGPQYPEALRQSKMSGQVLAQFVVDAAGKVDLNTLKIIKSDHPLFTDAVRTALASIQFDPATKDGRPVKQLMQLPFQFSLTPDE